MAMTSKSLDRIDRKILDELQKNARISYVELGERVGLSTSPCIERVKRLEQDNTIRGYTALLNPDRLQAGLMVYVEIKLVYDSRRIFEQFKQAALRIPYMLECHLLSGDFDYLMKIRVADMAEYRQLLGEILRDLPGVRDTRSYIVMEVIKESTTISTAHRN
ncbi:AsnC family transcriptional regulator [Chromatiales bacterium (ex Bugula neritina AB1)]|nr:AsnC family transcriptional regulator [Chromatiales bacterium (ex Bugula neritina AB1)]